MILRLCSGIIVGFIPGNVGRMDAIVRCGRCLAISRGLDVLERVYENASNLLAIQDNYCYRETNLYDEIVSW